MFLNITYRAGCFFRKMKIALGSTSKDKKEIIENTISGDILCFNVDSGVSDQPMSEDETIRGAINRSKSAMTFCKDCDFSVGLEGGLHNTDGNLYLICAAAVFSKKGELSVGVSEKTALPPEVSKQVLAGGSFGVIIRQYLSEISDNKPALNGEKKKCEELISRRKYFTQAISNAWKAQNEKAPDADVSA